MSTKSLALGLYRSILREHKNRLPVEMRILGDEYVRNEFKLHKTASEEQVQKFSVAWNNYLRTLRKQSSRYGRDLDEMTKENLSDEQK